MSGLEEIQIFLTDFHVKMNIWGVVRSDYSQGPIPDKLQGGADLWVFGKIVKGKEIYIKITMGIKGAQVICISFHIAEHRMSYPHKP